MGFSWVVCETDGRVFSRLVYEGIDVPMQFNIAIIIDRCRSCMVVNGRIETDSQAIQQRL